MRALTAISIMLMLGACSAALTGKRQPLKDSPWKIVEDWKVQLPGGGMQIFPAYTSVPGVYVATTSNGTVCGINTTTRAIQWTVNHPDVSFLDSVPSKNVILVARNSGTSGVDATTGKTLWSNSSIVMSPSLSEGYNLLAFDDIVVYRDQSSGFIRLCGLNAVTGEQVWCDSRRTLGSPDTAPNNTFTAMLFDASGNSYVACSEAKTGKELWIAAVDVVLTGSYDYVAVINGTDLTIVDTKTGTAVSSRSAAGIRIGSAVFVKNDVFAFSDNHFWVAALDCKTAKLLWNETATFMTNNNLMQLQHVGQEILVVATLSFTATNFTRFDILSGTPAWTVSAKPTGMSIAPVHAWLGADILYVRNTGNSWSAWGADSGEEISSGSGDLFLPRSVAGSFTRDHFSYYVSTNAGEMIDLRIERKTSL